MAKKESDAPLPIEHPPQSDMERMADEFFTPQRNAAAEEDRLRTAWQKAEGPATHDDTAGEVTERAAEVSRSMAGQPDELPEIAIRADIPSSQWRRFEEELDSPWGSEQAGNLDVAKRVFSAAEYQRYILALQGQDSAQSGSAQEEFEHAKAIASEPWPKGAEKDQAFQAARDNIDMAAGASGERKAAPPDEVDPVELMKSTYPPEDQAA